MRIIKLLVVCFVVAPSLAVAQPVGSAGSGSGSAGSASAPVGSGAAAEPVPAPGGGSGSAAPAPADVPMTGDAAALRKTCVAAMNADPSFAEAIVKKAEIQIGEAVNKAQVEKDLCTVYKHTEAQADIATNQRHVILAYAAMWLIAAAFVLFLWRRQQALKTEISQLRKDLEAAAKDAK
jgi:hypothetical protein